MNHRAVLLARKYLPYGVRVEIARLRHGPRRLLQRVQVARGRGDRASFAHQLAQRQSPLHRDLDGADSRLDWAKHQNVAAIVTRLHELVIQPHQIFSYHTVVGRPSLLRGFRRGLELHDSEPATGIGGGACKVSNLLYQLALLGGMKIVERHRHSLDLFPDKERTVPFGCGATVFYNYADLRFENPLPQPVLLLLQLDKGTLTGSLGAKCDPGWRAEIYETDHRFVRESSGWRRENRIRRRFLRPNGHVLHDEEVAHNAARVLYEPCILLPAPARPPSPSPEQPSVRAGEVRCCAP